jgi:hypothetical protein
MNFPQRLSLSLGALLLTCSVFAAEELKSGPQAGKHIPGPFHPLNINGSAAGEKSCQV